MKVLDLLPAAVLLRGICLTLTGCSLQPLSEHLDHKFD
jgi:hypothetical protein